MGVAGLLATDVASPSVQLHTLLWGWPIEPSALVALAIQVGVVVAYLAGVRRLAARGRRWSPWRTTAFVAGMAVVTLAVNSGLAAYDDSVFVVHVVQHILLMSVAPVLLALGAPVTLLLQAGDRTVQRRTLRVLNSRVFQAATFPVVVWLVFFGTMFAYFLTPLYALSLRHPLVHDYSHFQFLAAGFAYWLPIVGIDRSRWQMPYPARILYLFTGIPFAAFLGISLMSESRSISPAHTLADVHGGGAVLWAFGEISTLVALGLVVAQWAGHEERKAVREDRRLDAEAAAIAETATMATVISAGEGLSG